MLAIYKKELLSCFRSVIGWLYLAIATFFSSLFFIIFNMFGGYPYISYVLNAMITVLMFIIPVLTMRIISEEKRQKSDQLLLTAPVSPLMIVLGKYLALFTIYVFSSIPILLYPLFMRIFGEIPIKECYSSILGYLLFGATALAIGMFISSITERQVIAIIITYLSFLGMTLIPSFASVFLPASNWFIKILNILDVSKPTEEFFSGMLNLTSVLYYLSAIAIFILLTYRSVGKQTFSISTRGVGKVMLSISGTVIIVLAIIGANIGVTYIPEKYVKFDVTDNKMYSLTDTTKDFLATLTEDVTIYCLADENDMDTIVAKYLMSYEHASDRVHVEYRSPKDSPYFYKTYTDEQPDAGSLIVVYAGKSMVIPYEECYIHETGIDYSTYQTYDNVTGVNAEGKITAAISALITGDLPTIYVIEGHEELALNTYITNALIASSYNIENVSLINLDSIPEDVDMVLINAPKYDFNQEDMNKITKYIEQGGNGIFVLSSVEADTPIYDAFIEKYGVKIANGVVMEGNVNYTYQNTPYAVLTVPASNEITKDIGERYAISLFSKGFTVPESTDQITYNNLLTTSDAAYCKVNLTSTTTDKENGDVEGPFVFATQLDIAHNDNTSKIVLFASDQITNESLDTIVSHANSDIVLGSVQVSSQTELTAAVAPKSMNYDNLSFNTGTVFLYGILFILVAPTALLATGIVIWAFRRKK